MLGEPRLAEKMLKDAAKLDPNCPKIWQAYKNIFFHQLFLIELYILNRFSLGQIMQTLGDFNASADCFATSLQLEPSCPVLPFTSIPLVFE